MFHIYSDEVVQERLQHKRSHLLLMFAAGIAFGLWLAKAGLPLPEAFALGRPSQAAPSGVQNASCDGRPDCWVSTSQHP